MDLSSLVVACDIAIGPVGIATPLVSGAHSLFSRLRWVLSGTEVENIENYNVCSEMFHRLLPSEAQQNVELSAFAEGPMQPGSTKNILMMPKVSGLCNQHLWLPCFSLAHPGAPVELHPVAG